jgi:hypothetical protein
MDAHHVPRVQIFVEPGAEFRGVAAIACFASLLPHYLQIVEESLKCLVE